MSLRALIRVTVWVALSLALGAPNLHAAGKTTRLKLGTIAPAGTSYHKSLQSMGEKWRKASDGAVQLVIFPGGTQGSEADMVGLMQTGNLDAAMITAEGLSQIDKDATALQIMPMAFRNLEEVDYLNEKLRPKLEAKLSAKGYLVLFWSDSGWVRFFSKSPVVYPDDLRKLKVFSWAGNANQFDLWKASGFSPVELETSGIAQGLLSGTISAVPTVPIFALAAQLDTQARHMLEINWGPLVGAAVVTKRSWNRVPAAARDAMLKIADETGQQIKTAGRAENDAAVAAMVKRGLVVHPMTPEAEAKWLDAIDKVKDQIPGKIVPADTFDEAQRLLKQRRAGTASK
ncbi:MAG TPA: TRAP transporter substrate-binding protein DctP [Candidatus Paceibacterota bacterium]|nr:TRAP transporter substrate-binding protein DctP [Verrucomicrobiota bacterium]HSA09062.1 TRAP transporter substrate-binding protein DctP [Candidatus Paceibacterota bacterium]